MGVNKELNPLQFTKKAIAVVGNSERIKEHEYGDLIDSHDLVIRFNRAWPNKMRKREVTGKKTDFMSLVVREGYGPMIKRNPHVTFFLPMPPPLRWDRVPDECKELPAIGRQVIIDLKKEFGLEKRPSSGMSTLFFLLYHCNPKSVSIFGMDGMKTGKWYEKKGHWNGHDRRVEGRFLEEISKLDRVNFYG